MSTAATTGTESQQYEEEVVLLYAIKDDVLVRYSNIRNRRYVETMLDIVCEIHRMLRVYNGRYDKAYTNALTLIDKTNVISRFKLKIVRKMRGFASQITSLINDYRVTTTMCEF